jgi:PadR family transcriptional regulator AphA
VTELSLADQVCLAVIGEDTTHGWALVKLLAPDGPLGRIWSLSRPLTYRSIDRLVEFGLVARADTGRRTELRLTAAGRRARRRWLDEPVEHLRDLRTTFLVKLELRRRGGLDTSDLIERQRRQLEPAIEALTAVKPDDLAGPLDPVEVWRQESADAARRFLDRIADP